MTSTNGRSIKVLHVIPAFYPAFRYGGPIQTVHRMCRGLLKAGCEVKVLTTDANGKERLAVKTDRECEIEGGVRVRYCRRLWRDSVSSALLMALREYCDWADVIHLTGVYSFPTIPTLTMARVLKRPVVWSPRGALQSWAGERRRLVKWVWREVCRVVVPEACVVHVTSETEGESSKRRLPEVPILLIPNGVDVPDSVETRRPAEDLRFLYLGRLHPIKGLDALIGACEILQQKNGIKAWRVTVAGAGSPAYERHLHEEVVRRRLSDRIRFVGEVVKAKKSDLLKETDVLLLPSRAESFGMVVVEALSYGVPVIASRRTPWRELESEGCGLWAEDTPEGLAMSMQRIADMPLVEMGAKGRRWMQEKFDWHVTSARMADAYRRVVGGSR